MSVGVEDVREVALALDGTTEVQHFERTAFRTKRKIFATLDPAPGDLNLMFDPEHRDFFCEQEPEVFTALAGAWGRQGATRCDLATVDQATLAPALQAAHRLAAPVAKGRRGTEA